MGKPWYSEYFEKEVGLSAEDQKWIWGNIPHTDSKEKEISKINASVNGSVNGTYKNGVNTDLTLSKHRVITLLKECNYRTPPKKIASLLRQFFLGWGTKEGHWLYIAQQWHPRTINWVIAGMIKQHKRGETTIINPAKYFTSSIQFRVRRKRIRSTSDTYKHKK